MQNAGRGRRGRVWQSPEGTTISMSIALKPEFAPEYASMLTLVSAHSTLKALEEITHADIGIKWPNDLVIDGRKICGILTEMNTQVDYIRHVVMLNDAPFLVGHSGITSCISYSQSYYI